MQIEDCVWRGRDGKVHRPLPQRLGVRCRGKSQRLERALTDFGADESFARASAKVREHYGFDVGASAVRMATLKHARAVQSRGLERCGRGFRAMRAQGPKNIVCEADGSFLRLVQEGLPRKGKRPREWKEVRVVAAQSVGSASATYAATFGTPEEAGRYWAWAARQEGWALKTNVHGIGDGAEWIVGQLHEIFGKDADYLIDFYHLVEYIAAAGEKIAPTRFKHWLRVQKRRLKKGQHGKVVAVLKQNLEPSHCRDEEAPVRRAWRYMSNRPNFFDYHLAQKNELPIGSGMIESSHGHILQSRLKKNGMAWTRTNAEPIVQLRVLRANSQWNSYWDELAA